MGEQTTKPIAPLLVMVGVGALAAGFAVGIFAGYGRAKRDLKSRDENHVSKLDGKPRPTVPPVAEGESVDLRKTIATQRERIRELETLLVAEDRKGKEGEASKDKLALAKEIYELFVRLGKGKADSDEALTAMGRLSELNPDMASFFIERARQKPGKDSGGMNMALFLMLACGGPEVSAFIHETLTDPSIEYPSRKELLGTISGGNGMYTVPQRIPVDENLARVAFEILRSEKSYERKGAVSLLGGVNSTESRGILQETALSDSDVRVREGAVRSLGYVGDASTVSFLENYPVAGTLPEGLTESRAQRALISLGKAAATARQRLEAKK